ncbi:MAG: transcriptional regulator [Anaerolineae bacterium]|nr:transcriptional regulator [Anaerolineae bacterium]
MFTFVESTIFARFLPDYLTDEEYMYLQLYLAENPESGAIVPGSGGVRKLRWRIAGGGKRGGLRIIYYVQWKQDEIWLLTLYGKTVTDNIPGHLLRQLKDNFDNG